ncbi:MAG: hypothetical protein LBJ22_03790, partial [Synergistaceae bacterium]|nr:hypothetical protein [Synergistaceae bacterium]
MKMLKVLKVLCVLAVVFCFAAKGYAASPEKVFAVNNGNWVLKSGGEPEGSCGASLEQEMYWYAVDPEFDKAAKGLRRGVLLYDAEGERYSFLPTSKEQTRVESITFSPDKKRMVLSAD